MGLPNLETVRQDLRMPTWADIDNLGQQIQDLKMSTWSNIDILSQDPSEVFHSCLLILVSVTGLMKIVQSLLSSKKGCDKGIAKKPHSIGRLQNRFLAVFWSMRVSFWMSGPYFYAAYASKVIDGEPLSMAMISYISLSGYAAIALFGPLVGKISDQYGHKTGTIAATVFYALGNLTIVSDELSILLLGRVLGGLGTCLMSSSPEAWVVSQFQQKDIDPKGNWLRETFGQAYSFDSVIAIGAGQLAGWAAAREGPTGPFQLSPAFMAVAGFLTLVTWREAPSVVVAKSNEATEDKKQPTVYDALQIIRSDTKILCLGGVQSLFEGAMYIFVLQWPPTMKAVIQKKFGEDAEVPYGAIFSCFMACCMLGSSSFGWLTKIMNVEVSCALLLGISSIAMDLSIYAINGRHTVDQEFWLLTVAYFVFEACVGMYFPSIGTLRGKHIPDSHRSLIMTIYGVPLNILVVTVYVYQDRLGCIGALLIAAAALAIATQFMIVLHATIYRESLREQARERFKAAVKEVQQMNMFARAVQSNSTQMEQFHDSGINSPYSLIGEYDGILT